MSRVYKAHKNPQAIKAADENLEVVGSVMASDAFFPFATASGRQQPTGWHYCCNPAWWLLCVTPRSLRPLNEKLAMAMGPSTGNASFRH